MYAQCYGLYTSVPVMYIQPTAMSSPAESDQKEKKAAASQLLRDLLARDEKLQPLQRKELEAIEKFIEKMRASCAEFSGTEQYSGNFRAVRLGLHVFQI